MKENCSTDVARYVVLTNEPLKPLDYSFIESYLDELSQEQLLNLLKCIMGKIDKDVDNKKGITWDAKRNKYWVRVKGKHVGYYENEELAIVARDNKKKELGG